jgi:hypothetical protein
VPKERAGMAAGIFSTTRVAGEGVALAIATAILAALAHTSLSRIVPTDASVTARISEAAQRMTAGDVVHATAALPEVSKYVLSQSYADAFTSLLHVLIVITLLSAAATFAFLSRTPAQDDDSSTPLQDKEKAEEAITA